jgi:hypothetical protein
LIGLDSIFGAFLFGLAIPRGSHLYRECREYIEEFVLTFTLPLYFTLSGLKTDVATIGTGAEGGMVILVCFCATAGKFVGAGVSAYFSGCTIRESSVIAVLMNTRGLVELIVLNVGLQSGILNTRTFSVMVIMCLFTTFITSPLVSVIYPESMRLRAESAQSVKDSEAALIGGSGHDVEMTKYVGNEPELPLSVTKKLGIIIESCSQMQGVISLLSYFLPYQIGSEFGVTAMHFIEPTKTKTDEFLGLNEDGRLIRIDEETTDLSFAFQLMEDPAAKKPELLPISAYCNAFHIPVNAFRIEGDPVEYPAEVKSISLNNDINMLCLPFRGNSTFAMNFFWSSLYTSPVPILLLLQVNASSSGHRSNFIAPTYPTATPTATAVSEPVSTRARNGSYMRASFYEHHAGDEECPVSFGPTLFTNQHPDVLPFHRRGSVTNKFQKVETTALSKNTILILLTGKHADLNILSSLLGRFLENSLNEIHIFLPKDYATSFSSTLNDTITNQKNQLQSSKNLFWKDLQSEMTDYEGLLYETDEISYDLFVCSFVEPVDGMNGINLQHHSTVVGSSRTARTATIGTAFVDMFVNRSPEHDPIELRMQSGMPLAYANSSLPYPELGIIGSKIYENAHTKSSLVLIVHEPLHKTHGRASVVNQTTINSTAAPEPAEIFSLKTVNQDEEVLSDNENKEGKSEIRHTSAV